MHVEGAAEDAGEGQHVVDLVGEVGAAGRDDASVSTSDVGVHLGRGVGEPEDDGLGRHPGDVLLRHGAAGDTEVDVGSDEHVLQAAGAAGLVGRHLGQGALDRGEVAARRVQHALAVGDGEVGDAGLEQDLGDRDTRGAGARDDDPGRARVAAGQLERVGEGRQRHHRGAVLVVVEDGDVEQALEPILDLEAAWCRDVLEVDPTEAGCEPHDGLDDLLGVGRVEADRDGVDAAELLEQHGLALHHRHRGGRTDVAQPEHRGAVADDGDGVGHPRVVLGHARVGRDRLAHQGHTRGVGERQVAGPVERDGRVDRHLAAGVQVEDRVTLVGVVEHGSGTESRGDLRCGRHQVRTLSRRRAVEDGRRPGSTRQGGSRNQTGRSAVPSSLPQRPPLPGGRPDMRYVTRRARSVPVAATPAPRPRPARRARRRHRGAGSRRRRRGRR
ncbi:unannotated protein [freshwater metagenome]|uniref:Unannotated protein n=1 Tax=freshwater metagenome TaxID=449393 RepID=A0A6J6S8M0_9ZZZZ